MGFKWYYAKQSTINNEKTSTKRQQLVKTLHEHKNS